MKIISVFFVLIFCASFSLFAENTERTASIIDLAGEVSVTSPTGETVPAKKGMTISAGDTVETGKGAMVYLELNGVEKSRVEIGEGSHLLLSELLIDQNAGSQQTLLDLSVGKILVEAEKLHDNNSHFSVKTPTSLVGVRGTTFEVRVENLGEEKE